jgi:hypothetical protein
VRQRLIRILLLVVPPSAFLLKDIVATIAVLSTEPGITAKASLYYHTALVPGVLWFDPEAAMLFNFIFGALVGLILYLCVRLKKMWLLSLPPLAFFSKDVIATTTFALSTRAEATARASHYYAIALLPGSALERFGDPILFNILFGAVLGLVLYLRAVRRSRAVS